MPDGEATTVTASPKARPGQLSSYLGHLPAAYQQALPPPPAEGIAVEEATETATLGAEPLFLGRFLLAFEQILTGLGDVEEPGIAEVLDGIPSPTGGLVLHGVERHFDPREAPTEFLEWLAGWVALSLRADLDEIRRRQLIGEIASLYRLRGTKVGLERLVGIYTQMPVTIDELGSAFQIGVSSTIGVDTVIDGGPPFFFRILVRLPVPDEQQRRRQVEVARAIIDMEKPAHTYYELEVETPSMQIGRYSTIGVDTVVVERAG